MHHEATAEHIEAILPAPLAGSLHGRGFPRFIPESGALACDVHGTNRKMEKKKFMRKVLDGLYAHQEKHGLAIVELMILLPKLGVFLGLIRAFRRTCMTVTVPAATVKSTGTGDKRVSSQSNTG